MKRCGSLMVKRIRPRVLIFLMSCFPNKSSGCHFGKWPREEINYRRFFCVNGLISLRVEDEHVLNYTHGLIFDLLEKGVVTGLRIDHVDGLYDPASYLQKVREKAPANYIMVL